MPPKAPAPGKSGLSQDRLASFPCPGPAFVPGSTPPLCAPQHPAGPAPGECGLTRGELMGAPHPGPAFVPNDDPSAEVLCQSCRGTIPQHPPGPAPGKCGLSQDGLASFPCPGPAFVPGSTPPLCAECGGRISQHPPGPTAVEEAKARKKRNREEGNSDVVESDSEELARGSRRLHVRKSDVARIPTDVELFVEDVNGHDNSRATVHLSHWVDNLSWTDDSAYCAPYKVQNSWGKELWQKTLKQAQEKLSESMKDEKGSRSPLVLGIHAGTGNGKTHSLLEAGENLNATSEIYITYNFGQEMGFDRMNPAIAVLLRVLLRDMEISNLMCAYTFSRYRDELQKMTPKDLLNFVVWRLVVKERSKSTCATLHIFIAVDEIRKLMVLADNTPVLATISTLGLLARKLQENGVKCTIIVSALAESTFVTKSDRPVFKVRLPQPSDEARDFVLKELFGERKPTEQQEAMLAATCGTHFRSIVIGCQALLREANLDVRRLLDEIGERTDQNMDASERGAIRDYAQMSVSTGSENALSQTPLVAPFLDNLGSVAPAIVSIAFAKDAGMPEFAHPVEKLFETSAFIDAPKQLEHCAYHYDRFRALYGLPVVPYGAQVQKCGMVNEKWFRELSFPLQVAYEKNCDTSSLFAVKSKRVVRTKHKLELGKYWLPDADNHPHIDRACLAVHPDKTQCVVLYQDKINGDGMRAAVDGLNAAASALHQEMSIPVLCVAQVIGASQDTTSQMNFQHPHLLIRDDEVPGFYTPTFAPALRFVRHRHVLGK